MPIKALRLLGLSFSLYMLNACASLGDKVVALKDIPYAVSSKAQKLDLYLPDHKSGPYPLLIFIHGGRFESGSKSDIDSQLLGLEKGYAVASLNYRLSDEATFPAQVHDVKAAVKFLRKNSSSYRLKPGRFAAWGEGAGGNLAAMLGSTANNKNFYDNSLGNQDISDKIQAVVNWYGPIFFADMDAQFRALNIDSAYTVNEEESPESRYLGAVVGTKAATNKVKVSSPQSYINKNMAPIMIQHGTKDHYVPYIQSKIYVGKLRKVLGNKRVVYNLIDQAGHEDSDFSEPENLEQVFGFLDRHLKK
ncbi:MAG: alpha/beta hydrolase [Oligoflexales bacterium]|nr:alpha/beta hydrolase [Oligoflexales bacterium]